MLRSYHLGVEGFWEVCITSLFSFSLLYLLNILPGHCFQNQHDSTNTGLEIYLFDLMILSLGYFSRKIQKTLLKISSL